ncbi:MAG TPA: CoA-binding protein [Anaerolineales bacterium]|nr:CoA-binding protein [Anaerolineales bacterium]
MIKDSRDIRRLLEQARVIAVVGHSDNPQRTSYRIAAYLREVGYRVHAVNPTIQEVDGQPVYPSLAEVPEPIDIVDVFRRSEFLDEVVDQAIAVGAKAVWAQLGVFDEAAGRKAEAAGLEVVMDRCIVVDHRNLLG